MKELYFKEAIVQAKLGLKRNEVPIGAILVQNGKIIAKAHNQTEKRRSFLAHAELLVLLKASQKLKSKFIPHAEIYVTVEPCMMCRFAARLCRIESIHYLAPSEKFGRNTKRYFKTKVLSSRLGLRNSSVILLRDFFQGRRSSKMKR